MPVKQGYEPSLPRPPIIKGPPTTFDSTERCPTCRGAARIDGDGKLMGVLVVQQVPNIRAALERLAKPGILRDSERRQIAGNLLRLIR